MDPEDVEAILRPYHARVRTELERYGGTVEKFIGDAVMALFGAPVAHEDDPERAVRAALAIRDFAVEKGLELRVGITTGEALVQLDAQPDAGEGMASGDVVNTAARLQSAAPDQRRARRRDDLPGDACTPSTTRTPRPSRRRARRSRSPCGRRRTAHSRFGVDVAHEARAELVGRERELGVIRDAFERARHERTPQLLTLVGVPGIGKSRLVYELSRIADADPELVTWRQGRCLAYGDGVTLWALSEIVKAQAGIVEQDTPADVEQKLRVAVDDVLADTGDANWVESQLRSLVGLSAESELGDDRRGAAFAAWRRFLEAMAEQRPLIVVFEDLHWADESLLDFVDELVDWVTDVPLLAVATARPELLERRPGWGGGKLNATTLALPPLSEDQTALLIAQLLERSVLPAESQQALLERAGGNPLYAEQFAELFLERGSTDELGLPEIAPGNHRRPSRRACRQREESAARRRRDRQGLLGVCRSQRLRRVDDACTRSSARDSCAARSARPSKARPSSRLRMHSFATSPTGRSPEPTVQRSTAASQSGSRASGVRKTTLRCSPTTGSRRSSSLVPQAWRLAESRRQGSRGPPRSRRPRGRPQCVSHGREVLRRGTRTLA